MNSLMHDVAFIVTQNLMAVISGIVREDEYRDCFWEVYRVVKAGLECFAEKADRRLSRLTPSKN